MAKTAITENILMAALAPSVSRDEVALVEVGELGLLVLLVKIDVEVDNIEVSSVLVGGIVYGPIESIDSVPGVGRTGGSLAIV